MPGRNENGKWNFNDGMCNRDERCITVLHRYIGLLILNLKIFFSYQISLLIYIELYIILNI